MTNQDQDLAQAAVEHLFRLEDAPDPVVSSTEFLGFLRRSLEQAGLALNERFRQGEPIRVLIFARALVVDRILIAWWNAQAWPAANCMTLLAVGGYGRGELHPQSDIDLLILSSEQASPEAESCAQQFLTGLWDLNLKIGHAVRSLDDCINLAREDITIATNIMEARLLAGDENLCSQLLERSGPENIWPTKEFFSAKWLEQRERHHKYNDTEYNLEPNLKSAPGGLRDIQTVGWVAKRHFNAESFEDLVELGFINFPEYQTLQDCQDCLWRFRYALHMLTNRPEDRLLFDHQRSLAALFGLTDTAESLAVEKLMQDYYLAAQQVSHVNELLLQHFDEAILRAGEPEFIEPLNERFQVRNNYIEVMDGSVFDHCPFALIEIFVLLARSTTIQGIRAQTVRMICIHAKRLDDRFRNDTLCTALFMELLRNRSSATELKRMHRYGLLGHWLPEFASITGQMQHDLFHIYTVDAHTLRVVQNMQEIGGETRRKDFPDVAEVMDQLPKIELLYIAGLYHDIAKGRGGDHSSLGVADVCAFAARHHLSDWDIDLLSWLVEQHLVLSMTAQRQDIADPEVIHDFAVKVKSQVRLDYLYALTIADICATNPTLWNGWRATLLRQLYQETRRALQRGLDHAPDRDEAIEETQLQALEILNAVGVRTDDVRAFWDLLGDEYFLQDTPQEIAWHTQAILEHGKSEEPLVLIRDRDSHGSGGGTTVFIYTSDQANLFAATAAALDQLHLNIHDARIMTSASNFSMDTYIVLEENDQPVPDDPERISQIQTTLQNALSNPEEYPRIVERHTPRQLRHFAMPTEVEISNDPARRVTLLELRTPDRPGLLARVGRIFMDFDIELQMAKISTLGERVEDVFYLTDHRGKPLSDADLCTRLRDTLRQSLDARVEAERSR